jgi:hypothetical protein
MISKTAKADIEDMWEEGLEPTFDDIVRLNALALEVERTRSGFALNHLPRVAFLGEVAFREPTIGADIWLDEASQLFAVDKAETFMLLRAFSLSMPQDKLPDPYDEKAVLKGVAEMSDRLAFATLRQMSAAIGYAVHGFEHDSCEVPVASTESSCDDGRTESVQSSYDIGLLREGIALRLGSAAELRALPRREMREMILRAIQSQTVQNVRKDTVSLAEDNYLRTLDAITERLEKESWAQVPEEHREVEESNDNHDAGSQTGIHGGASISRAESQGKAP